MSLDTLAHVEAVSIIRRLVELAEDGEPDPEAIAAARLWLEEHHPSPGDYVDALRASRA